MITDLFAAVSRIDRHAFDARIPPDCRREPSAPPLETIGSGELLLEFPVWRPRIAARHLLPSLSVLTGIRYAARFELSVSADDAWSPWVASATVGPGELAPLPEEAGILACDIDVFSAAVPVKEVRLRVRVAALDPRELATAPWMATLSASDLAPLVPTPAGASIVRLPVPARSQLDASSEIALRICSPVSVAMVLDYWGVSLPTVSLAAEIFHAGTDRYGVWPAAIQAAGHHGVAGYLLRFPGWSAAAWCLERGLPIIASINYGTGELAGAPMAETSGHLIVLTGLDGPDVMVNDPVAATAAKVPRRYRLSDLHRVWLERTGVGYVLFPPPRPPSS